MKKYFIVLLAVMCIFISGCSWFDKEAPVISFENGDLIEIEYGSEYDDSDIEITDNKKGDILVSIEGKIDFDTLGENELLYIAIDKAGNRTEKKRNIKLIDTKPPTIELIGGRIYCN